ncbi:hypothetical protein [Natronoflexus pectinivorans]|uniref:Uncharacterized protein n=1 Tax=Natronoflexus pectinivorans TaxID=682526 RepID=A0A4R2GC02_9BACT|nr:hypothetical protein [Natronoflexus pectinivorans]TCO05370.1 hypothetical protein EV194_1162 [Natronoflexus pectinivorans]
MTKRFRNIAICLFATIYCFAMVVVPSSLAASDSYDEQTVNQERFISGLSVINFNHTSQTDSSLSIFTNLSITDSPIPFIGYHSIVDLINQLFKEKLIKSRFFTENVLINHRKSDIIFPFHYFW